MGNQQLNKTRQKFRLSAVPTLRFGAASIRLPLSK